MKDKLLAILRDRKTSMDLFRAAADKLVETMVQEVALEVKQHNIIVIPILRAGMVFLPPFLKTYPQAKVGFFGIRRDEKTAKPIPYYEKLPKIDAEDHVFLVDPMIATGGSALYALERLAELEVHPSRLTLLGIIGSVEGITLIKKKYPYLTIRVEVEDPSLDAQKFIVPGLGDFGDRYFGTS